MFSSRSTLSSVLVLTLTLVRVSWADSASCLPGFEWANNSLVQNPCQIAGALEAACQGFSSFDLPTLAEGTNYVAPQKNSSSDICECNTVMYSLYMGCTACQNRTVQKWSFWEAQCAQVFVTQYPNQVPLGTAVPHWAYLDVTKADIFDPALAQAAGDSPESVAPVPSTASLPGTPINSQSSVSPSNSDSSSGADPSKSPNSPGDNQQNVATKKTSNAGAIAGGIIGGLVFLGVVGGAIFWYLRRQKQRDSTEYGYGESVYSGYRPKEYEIEPYTQSQPSQPSAPMRVYNPADPTTYPQDSGANTLFTTSSGHYNRGGYTGAAEV